MASSRAESVMVTGCAGFIGAQVCAQLLSEGRQVIGIDNLNDAYDVALKQWRLGRLSGRPGFRFHPVDITDADALEQALAVEPIQSRIAGVINLAARAGVRYSVVNPWVYYQTNVIGALNLLDWCRRNDVSKFVLASSSSLYGASDQLPYREDQCTDRPLSPYAASKKAAESLCYSYHHLHGLDVTVFRYFTVYGPAGRPDMLPFRLVQWISEGQPVTVYGDGMQSRDFTYVDDIARGTIAGLIPLGYAIINLGSDAPVTVMEMIRLVEKALSKRAIVRHEPMHPADVRATWADISTADRLLAWKPATSIATGMAHAVDWYLRERDWARNVSTA
jgi:nucleoside-diphosphate-sugar epimerase